MRVDTIDTEFQAIINEAAERELKRVEELETAGKMPRELISDGDLFDDIRNEMQEKIKALAEKYGIRKD